MTVDVTWAINGKERSIFSEIYGTKAGASLDPFCIYGEEAGYLMNCTPVAEPENMFNNEIRHFIDCIKLGQQPIATLEDGMAVQKS